MWLVKPIPVRCPSEFEMLDGSGHLASSSPMVHDVRGAEQRRRALKRALAAADMTPADAARVAELPTANGIYNFFSGRTQSLSIDTYRRLAEAIPGETISSLQGIESRSTKPSRAVMVRAEARAGVMRDTFDLAPHDQVEMPVPIDPGARAAGAFAVVVRRPGAELLYPEGTILVLMPVNAYEGTLSNGRRLVLQRIANKAVEVTVRELEVRDGKAWLWPRSSDPRFTVPVEMPWPYAADRMWKKGEDRFSIAGLVIGSYTPEG